MYTYDYLEYRVLETYDNIETVVTKKMFLLMSLDPCKGLKFNAPNNVGYKPYLDVLQAYNQYHCIGWKLPI